MLALGAATLVGPRTGRTQSPPKVGWLKIQDKSHTPGQLAAFIAGMAALGHREGRTFALEPRFADGDAARLAPLAEELVAAGVAVIAATSQPATDAARRITRTVPIFGRMTDDPVQTGVAQSLARPGGNVTGVYSLLEEMSPKRLALLRDAVPAMRTVGALLTLDRGATVRWLADTEAAARQLGVGLHVMDVRSEADLDPAFAKAAEQRVDGILAFRNPTIVTHAKRVIALADRYRMPSIFDARDFVEAGALMSYGPNLDAIFRRGASYVDQILKGAKPGELPIEQPSTLELVVNMKTAKAMGLAISPAILTTADAVIE